MSIFILAGYLAWFEFAFLNSRLLIYGLLIIYDSLELLFLLSVSLSLSLFLFLFLLEYGKNERETLCESHTYSWCVIGLIDQFILFLPIYTEMNTFR